MSKDKKNKTREEAMAEYYATHDVIDDSRMPSPEQVAKLPKTPELDNEIRRRMDELAKEFGMY